MKKVEHILYILTLLTVICSVVLKPLNIWWFSYFNVIFFCSLSFVYAIFTFIIYTLKNNPQSQREYFLFYTIPLGIALASLMITVLSQIENWDWDGSSFKATLILFVIVEVILIIAYFLEKKTNRKSFLKQNLFKTLIFILFTLIIKLVL